MFQNDDGSWKGFYSNGKGCKRHKSTATRWSGCPAAHLRFHLLKRGVTNDSALNLIRRSFTPQAFRDALQATDAMIQQWVDANGSNNIPANLADLAKRAQVTMSTFTMPR